MRYSTSQCWRRRSLFLPCSHTLGRPASRAPFSESLMQWHAGPGSCHAAPAPVLMSGSRVTPDQSWANQILEGGWNWDSETLGPCWPLDWGVHRSGHFLSWEGQVREDHSLCLPHSHFFVGDSRNKGSHSTREKRCTGTMNSLETPPKLLGTNS